MYALCWTGTDRPSALFERAVTWLVTHKVLLPGCSTLERYVAHLRSRVEERLWRSLGRGIRGEQRGKLESLRQPDLSAMTFARVASRIHSSS